jgi:type VI secretion system protein ImpK
VGELGLLNPLVSAAGKLLVLIGKLRNLAQPPNVPALRASTADAVNQFDANARRAGVSNESVLAARYVLCTALDEAVANTPWGVQAGWNKQSLLVQFHNETWGGEKVFQLLAKLAQDVPTHRQLLELIYSVLALGFEGRYRVVDNGRAQLDSVRQRLADLIAKDRPPSSPSCRRTGAGRARARCACASRCRCGCSRPASRCCSRSHGSACGSRSTTAPTPPTPRCPACARPTCRSRRPPRRRRRRAWRAFSNPRSSRAWSR